MNDRPAYTDDEIAEMDEDRDVREFDPRKLDNTGGYPIPPYDQETELAEPLPRLVIIQVTDNEFHVQTQGVENISVPTLLRLAALRAEREMGL